MGRVVTRLVAVDAGPRLLAEVPPLDQLAGQSARGRHGEETPAA